MQVVATETVVSEIVISVSPTCNFNIISFVHMKKWKNNVFVRSHRSLWQRVRFGCLRSWALIDVHLCELSCRAAHARAWQRAFGVPNASIEQIEETFTSKLGSVDQFGWFMVFMWCSSWPQRDVCYSCTYTHLLHAHFSAHSACTVTFAHFHACA